MKPPPPHRSPLGHVAQAARPLLPLILILAALFAAWGGYRGYRYASHVRWNAINNFAGLNQTIGMGLFRMGVRLQKWDPAVGGHITLDNITTELSTLDSMSGLLRSTGEAASVWGQPRLEYDQQLSNSLRSLQYTLSMLNDRTQVRGATTIDRHFVGASGERLIAIDDKLRRIPQDRSEHPQPTWREWEAAVLGATESLSNLCWAYYYEGATAKGTRVASVSAERAEGIARAHLGPAEGELKTQTTEVINWWAGVHYWKIWLIDEQDRHRYRVMVDARDGSVLGWWDMIPNLPRVKAPLEQAEAAARAYLAANLPGEHLLAGFKDEYEGYGHGDRWVFNFYPQIDGVTYFGDPVTVAVAGPDCQVVGCTKPYRTAPTTQAKPDPGPLAAAARQSLRERLDAEPQVTAEGWAVRRLSGGDPILTWAVTAATPQEPGPNTVRAADGSKRLAENPTHLVAFAEATTGTHLDTLSLWLAGDSWLYHRYGGTRR